MVAGRQLARAAAFELHGNMPRFPPASIPSFQGLTVVIFPSLGAGMSAGFMAPIIHGSLAARPFNLRVHAVDRSSLSEPPTKKWKSAMDEQDRHPRFYTHEPLNEEYVRLLCSPQLSVKGFFAGQNEPTEIRPRMSYARAILGRGASEQANAPCKDTKQVAATADSPTKEQGAASSGHPNERPILNPDGGYPSGEESGARPWAGGHWPGAEQATAAISSSVREAEPSVSVAHPASGARPQQPHRQRQQPQLECSFCRRLGETRSFCSTHVLRDPLTKAVVCPILRKYRCEICGATGDNSHTRSYCPLKPEGTHNMALLKSTPRNSTHRRRRK